MLTLAVIALSLWFIIMLLPWRPWLVLEKLDVQTSQAKTLLENFSDVSILIPARNEENVIERSIEAAIKQGPGMTVIVINDRSTDATLDKIRPFESLITIIDGSERPAGWSGKLWALEQGWEQTSTPLIMLMDADIQLRPGIIGELRRKLVKNELGLVSLMARPSLTSFWEKLIMPAFVYYFKMLYPFSLANSNSKLVAAAAGGCILMKREVLDRIGGFKAIRSAVIDDCRLAREAKNNGFKTWLGLTHSVRSIRPYRGLGEIWDMVSRTAFTQLNYSVMLLLICSAIMVLAYFIPVMVLWSEQTTALVGAVTLVLMHITYLPVLSYYRLSWLWAPVMPLIATLFLGMTWTSAYRYWMGERLRWKGRTIMVSTK